MFDGSLGNYTGTEYKIELLEQTKLYHAKPFPIPKVHEETLKTEVDRLVNIGILKHKDNSKWAASTFIIPKKNGKVCFISDYKELNKRMKRKSFVRNNGTVWAHKGKITDTFNIRYLTPYKGQATVHHGAI